MTDCIAYAVRPICLVSRRRVAWSNFGFVRGLILDAVWRGVILILLEVVRISNCPSGVYRLISLCCEKCIEYMLYWDSEYAMRRGLIDLLHRQGSVICFS